MIAAARARVVHSMPGRLRLRLDRRAADLEAVEPQLARLRARTGVRAARFNPASGSIVVEYDPAALTVSTLLDDLPLAEPLQADVSLTGVTSTPAARAVTSGWWEADAALARLSGGQLDLKLLVPLALVLVAVRQLLVQGELQAAPWHALLWYSYNLFYQFHPEMHPSVRVDRASGPAPSSRSRR